MQRREVDSLPRIPLAGSIDLTYRCNNACRHCWLWEPAHGACEDAELTAEEIFGIVDQARALGTREWSISGGEPMLRPDFSDIFEYVTERSRSYSLNTNGTLITPAIARQLRRPGVKMIAVYGPNAVVYDAVTRNPGGFESLVQGLSYMKEAGARFTVQLIPMRENWEHWDEMVRFAETWSDSSRVGAAWLYKSACQSRERNAEIDAQRLGPSEVASVDALRAGDDEDTVHPVGPPDDDRLYAACIEGGRQLHVDPYGTMSFCGFVKDPAMRYDLRSGTVEDAWERFIPSLSEAVRGGQEYRDGCGACEMRSHCRWCDVYGYLERGRHGAKVEYLCALAERDRTADARWTQEHVRHYEVAGITLEVESDLPFAETTLDARFESFRVNRRGADTVELKHHFVLPARAVGEGAREVYRRPPWAVYRHGDTWIYEVLVDGPDGPVEQTVAVFNDAHTRGQTYRSPEWERVWKDGGLGSLTLLPTDQILLARLAADRDGCILHSGAAAIDGRGLVFVGHSDAGKSTTLDLIRESLGDRARVLCDDRNIVRRWPDGFRVHGTWSHGDIADVSSESAPLRAILFLEQSASNEVVPVRDRGESVRRLLATLVRPMVSSDWWNKELDVIERIVSEVPCYVMRFDRSGAIVPELEKLMS